MMKISVIIPAYNAERFLERAVNSLVETAYPDLEIIIVDDGSADSTWAVAKRLKATKAEIKVLQHPDGQNHGVSASRNLGLERASGELIGFLDADDYVFPHRFDVAVPILMSDPQVAGVHELAIMEFESDRGKERFWDEDDLFGIRVGSTGGDTIDALLCGVCWPTSGILFRRQLLSKTGPFPESYDFAEDFHLWLRMACVARIVPGCPDGPVSVYFRHGQNSYHGGLERKTEVIGAMADVYGWLKNNPHVLVDRAAFAKPVRAYIRNALIRAREENRCDIGRKFLWALSTHRFLPAVGDTQLLLQASCVLAGRAASS
jgi:glycosyltransferase involved in cell wall biosynthesis